jgi:hypothetical protein
MSQESLQAEVEKLRAEVESHKQRELADLRAALAAAREEAVHFRQEAVRISDTGRMIASNYETQIAELRAKLEVFTRLPSPVRPTRNGA